MWSDCEREIPKTNNRKYKEESKCNVSVPGTNITAKNKPKKKLEKQNKAHKKTKRLLDSWSETLTKNMFRNDSMLSLNRLAPFESK